MSRSLVVVPWLGLLGLAACSPPPEPEADAVSREKPFRPAAAVGCQPDLSEPAESLRAASLEGLTEAVNLLLANDLDPNACDGEHRTPLMLAAFNGHVEILHLLLERGARLEDRDAAGRSALMFASTADFPEAVGLLIEAGAEVNRQDEVESWSALMFAAGEGQLAVVEKLLAARCRSLLGRRRR